MLNLSGMFKAKKRMIHTTSIDDLSDQDIIVAVIGPTGCGKSSFIQMATGIEGGIGHSLESCTTEISVIKQTLPELADSIIYFVDTPGFDNSNSDLSDETIGTMVSDLLSSFSKKKIHLTALLYFHRISENRFTRSNFRHLYHFKNFCKGHLDNAVLTTTMWGETDVAAGGHREKELITIYWNTMVRAQESIVKQFLHHHDSAIELLSPLVEKKNDILLQEHMKVISTSWHLPDGISGLQNLIARQQEVKKKIRGELRAPTELKKFLGLLDECHKLSADLESAVETMMGENIPWGGWFQKSIVQADWGRYLRTFLSKKARQKGGNLENGHKTNGFFNNDSLVTLGGGTSSIVKMNSSGAVESGTLEALVHILIENFGAPDHSNYCSIFLQTCSELKSRPKDDLDTFLLICKRFSEAENEQDDDSRIVTQYSVLLVFERWFKFGCFIPSEAAVSRLKDLFNGATKMNSTSLLKDRVENLLHLLKDGNSLRDLPKNKDHLEQARRGSSTSSRTPEGVATALTLLQGDEFKAIQPWDYNRHLTQPSSPNPSIERYQRTNDLIKTWVIDSILKYSDVTERLKCMNFFVITALACIEKGNFSSSTAIATALESDAIRNLELTKRSLPSDSAEKLATFKTILDPESKHHCYRAAFTSGSRKDVHVPCLPIYLKELRGILRQHPMTVGKVDGQYLINFKRYSSFMHCIKDHLRFVPLNMDDQRYPGEREYLLDQLRGVDISEQANKRRLGRSRALMAQEEVDHRARKVQLRQLGFA